MNKPTNTRTGQCAGFLRAAAPVFLSYVLISVFAYSALYASDDFHPVSLIYGVLWALLFTLPVVALPRIPSQVLFIASCTLFSVYVVAEHIYFRYFNKLFSFTVISKTSEGAGYFLSALATASPAYIAAFVLTVCFYSVAAAKRYRSEKAERITALVLLPYVAALLTVCEYRLPDLLGQSSEKAVWNSFSDPRYVYDNYSEPHKCLGMSGYYQWLALDMYNCYVRPMKQDKELNAAQVDEFFDDYPTEHEENAMTGILAGKNVVLIMAESMDYIALGENTPHINAMREQGMDFTRYYSAIYGDGATFSNEFVLNTGVYSPSDGKAAYSYIGNDYGNSLPRLFREAGYGAKSFHENYGWFYNRALMHSALGYESYNSFHGYASDDEDVTADTFLNTSDRLTSLLLGEDDGKPFFSFLITYSAHLPYDGSNPLLAYADETFGELDTDADEPDDLRALRSLARITDEAVGALVERADENTVFIFVTDHFAYGLSEDTLAALKGDEWTLRQNTPFFIYCKDPDFAAYAGEYTKICSNADFLPTVANLFGLRVPDNLPGHDIFDDGYDGYVIFSNYAWLTDDGYWHDGVIVSEDGCTEETIMYMTEYTYRRIKINDLILSSDYYGRK